MMPKLLLGYFDIPVNADSLRNRLNELGIANEAIRTLPHVARRGNRTLAGPVTENSGVVAMSLVLGIAAGVMAGMALLFVPGVFAWFGRSVAAVLISSAAAGAFVGAGFGVWRLWRARRAEAAVSARDGVLVKVAAPEERVREVYRALLKMGAYDVELRPAGWPFRGPASARQALPFTGARRRRRPIYSYVRVS